MAFKAQGFASRYGSNIAVEEFEKLGDYVLVTQPEPWELLKNKVSNQPLQIIQSGDLSPEHLDHLAETSPAVRIVGLGGGSAMDTAKWIHWRRQLPLTQFPSLPSVDACFTRMSALRDKGGVRYEGDAVPDCVVVDFDLFRSAPGPMVTSGIGDILSCHTAWFDWKLAADQGKDTHGWQESSPQISFTYLDELFDCAPGVKELTDDGLARLMDLHKDVGWRCHEMQHARFEEGSEHFFAYCFEEVTGRTILHGELVSLGVLLLSYFQGNNYERAKETILRAGTRHRPDELGVKDEEIIETLRRLPSFSVEQNHWWSQAQLLEPKNYNEKELLDLLYW